MLLSKHGVTVVVSFQATLDRLQKSLEAGFKSPHLPARMACLHSVLYLLQCDGSLEREVVTSLLPMTTDYLQLYLRHTSTSDLCHSEDHVTLMWAVAFYVIEYHHQHTEQVGNYEISYSLFAKFSKSGLD